MKCHTCWIFFDFLKWFPSFGSWISELLGKSSPSLFLSLAGQAGESVVALSLATSVSVSGGVLWASASTMMIKEASLRRDPDLRGELAFLAKGCDFVLPSRFKKRIKSFQQQQVSQFNKQDRQGASVHVIIINNNYKHIKMCRCKCISVYTHIH